MNRSPKPLGFFACLFLLLFTASVTWGQTGTSSLRGVVVDNSVPRSSSGYLRSRR